MSVCIDCGKKCGFHAKRCMKCHKRFRKLTKKVAFCLGCRKELSSNKFKWCKSCAAKLKWSNPAYRKLTLLRLQNYWDEYHKSHPWWSKRKRKKTKIKLPKKHKQRVKTRKPKAYLYKIGTKYVYKICLDCGKPIAVHATRCVACAHKAPSFRAKLRHTPKNIKQPNRVEIRLNRLLEQVVPSQYQYTGDGKTFIAGFVPDFVNFKRHKIIELFGDYWHTLPQVMIKDQTRLATYKRYNWDVLVIWEHDLKDTKHVAKLIKLFNCRG